MQLNSQTKKSWVRLLEAGITILFLLYFLGIMLPPPLPTLVNSLSYPVIAILAFSNRKRVLYVVSRDIPLLLFVGFATVSILWTANAGITAEGIRGLLRTLFFGAYIASRYSVSEQMKLWAWVLGIAGILSLGTAILMPSYGIGEHGWVGIFKYKNFLGYTMSIGATLCMLYALNIKKRRWLAWSGFCLATLLVLLSSSSGGLLSILVLISLVPLHNLIKQHYKIRTVLLSFSLLFTGCVAITVIYLSETILVEFLGKGLSFNGRTDIWELVIQKGLESPWLGYGLNAFWRSDAGIFVMTNTWAGYNEAGFNTHNSYLDIFLSLGIIGVSLYIISFMVAAVRTVKLMFLTQELGNFWLLQLLLFVLVSSLADSYDLIIVYMTTSFSAAINLEKAIKKFGFDNPHKNSIAAH
jgi:exopolysaccharide production protein ExoQ